MNKAQHCGALLVGVMTILVIISWHGLSGPLVFDDLPNLAPLANDAEEPDYRDFIFGNHAGVLGRSVSMATFAVNHWLRGDLISFDLKITNLAIHIANGALLYFIVLNLLQPTFAPNQYRPIALVVSACWLLSPMNSGVVFYAIQRMALLACFFVFAGILCYTLWRRGQSAPPSVKTATLILCISCWPLAFLAKENGILLPLYLLLIEFYFFASGRSLVALRIIFLSLFVCGCVAVYVLHTHGYLDYSNRNFTLMERLSTQPLVLAHYVGDLLFPAVVDIGLFNDDFPIKKSPWNIATLGYGAVIVFLLAACLSCAANSRLRPIWAGVLFFLVAHVAESTAIPLEIYFEHRNYLPSAGLFLAVVLAVNILVMKAQRWRALPIVLPIIVLAWFSFMSYHKATIWKSWPAVVANLYQQHPASVRAGLELAALLVQSDQGAAALRINDLNASYNPERSLNIKLQRFYIYCWTGAPIDDAEYEAISGRVLPAGLRETATAFEALLDIREQRACMNIDFVRVMQRVAKMVDDSLNSGLITTTQAWSVDYFVIEYARLNAQHDLVARRLRRSIEGGNAKARYYSDDVLNN